MRALSSGVAVLAALAGGGIVACASAPGPAGPAEGAASTVVVVPPAPTATAAPTAEEAAPPAPAETGCFARPVKMRDDQGRFARGAVVSGTQERLAACGTNADPDACRYEIAKAYHDANLFEESGRIFRDVAVSGKNTELGRLAAPLFLDAANIVAQNADPPRPECYDEMAESVAPLKARHCAVAEKGNADLCSLLDRIEASLERRAAEEAVHRADKGAPDAPALYRKAGDIYMASFQKRCAFQRPDRKKKPVPPPGWSPDSRCDEIVYNAMRTYMAAGETALAQGARAALLDPDNGLDKGPLAQRAAALEIR